MEWRFYDDSARLVEQNIGLMNARATDALIDVQETITSLADWAAPVSVPPVQRFDLPEISVDPSVAPSAPSVPDFANEVTDVVDPGWEDLAAEVGIDSELVNIPGPFSPTTPLPTFGDAPAPIATIGEPVNPGTTDVTIPNPPTWIEPAEPVFINQDFSPAPEITMPTFAGVRPVFTAVAPSSEFPWTEPVYSETVLTALSERISTMLAGGTGIPVVVQEAMWYAARSREDATALSATQAAFDTWASKGFGMPPGMLVRAVDAVNEKNRLASNDLSRTILTDASKAEIENMRAAIERGMALETMMHGWFEAAVQRSFDALKYSLDIAVKVYDVAVSLYNASQSAYQTDAIVFKARIEPELAKLDAWKKEIDGEIAKGEYNDQQTKLYIAKWGGVKAKIDAFVAEMTGAQTEAQVNRTIIDGYSAEVQAWGHLLDARKSPHEAYEITTRGKVAQVGAYEAEARGFAETVRAAEAEGNLKIKFVDARIATINASTQKYVANLQAERERVQAELAQVEAKIQAYAADVGRYRAEIEGETTARGQDVQISEMRTRTSLSYYAVSLREYDAMMDRQIQRQGQILEALKAAGQYGTGLAVGAMSAINVQAGIEGSGRVSDSYSYQEEVSHAGGPRP